MQALLARAAHHGGSAPAGEGELDAQRTMELLRRAAAMGYRNANAFRTDTALAPLCQRSDFRLLMMDMALPAEPFAR